MTGSVCAFNHCHNSASNSRGKSFFRLPAILKRQGEADEAITTARRAAWLAVLNRKDLYDGSKKLEYIHVCQDHFQGKTPSNFRDTTNIDWKPSVNLGGDPEEEARKAAAGKARQERRALRRKNSDAGNFPKKMKSTATTAPEIAVPKVCYEEDGVQFIVEEIFIPMDTSVQTDPVEFSKEKCVKEMACQTDISGEDIDRLNSKISHLRLSVSKLEQSMPPNLKTLIPPTPPHQRKKVVPRLAKPN